MFEAQRRRGLAAAVAWAVLSSSARAQPAGKVLRLAYLGSGSRGPRPSGYVDGLRELGYVEGQNLQIERRYADWRHERLPELADELVRTQPDLIVTATSVATQAAMAATRTIPIVFTGVSDPVDTRLVTNLSRPGGNVTGLSYGFDKGFASKWLQQLTLAAPKVTRVAALHDYPDLRARLVTELQDAALSLKLQMDIHRSATEAGLEIALAAIARDGAQGLVVTGSPFLNRAGIRARLIQFAGERRLPATYFSETFVAEGGLMSYGPDLRQISRRAAVYIDKIFRGARPGDLPVEQPTQFDLALNLKTARALGLVVPQALRLSATKVFE